MSAAAGTLAARQASFRRLLVSDAVRLAPGIASELLGGFGVSLILGRYLPAAAMGLYTLFWLAQSYAAALATGWLQNAVIRFLPEERGRLPRFVRVVAATIALTGLVGALVVAGIGALWSGTFRWSHLAWTVAILCGVELYALCQSMLRGSFDQWRYTTSAMLLAGLQVLLLLTLLPRAADPAGSALMAMALSYPTVVAWQLWRLRQLARAARARAPAGEGYRALVRRSLVYGFPLAISVLIVTLLQSGDRYVLAGLAGLEDVGVYAFWMGIGLQFGRGMYNLVFSVLNPRLFQLYGNDPAAARARVGSLAGVYVTLFAPLITVVGAAAPAMLALLRIRPEYVDSSNLMFFGLGTAFVLGLTQLSGKNLEFDGRTTAFVWAALFGALVMAAGAYVLVPLAGVTGAGTASLSGFVTYFTVVTVRARTWLRVGDVFWAACGSVTLAMAWQLATERGGLPAGMVTVALIGALYAAAILPRFRARGPALEE